MDNSFLVLTIQPLDSGDAVTLVNVPLDSERLFVNTMCKSRDIPGTKN